MAPLLAYRTQMKTALDGVDALPIQDDWKPAVKNILGNNVAFMDDCLAKGVITMEALQGFAKKQAPRHQAHHQLGGLDPGQALDGRVDGWKASLGADWDKTYAAANTIYVARQNNVLFSVLAQFFGPEAINDRLMLIETISFTTTPEDMLTSMIRIISDRSVGALFFGNDRLMDFELMGGDARKTIISEMQRRGKTAVPAAGRAVRLQAVAGADHAGPGPDIARRPEVRIGETLSDRATASSGSVWHLPIKLERHAHESQHDRRGQAAQVVRGGRMARRPRLAGRRHLAVLRAAGQRPTRWSTSSSSAGRR